MWNNGRPLKGWSDIIQLDNQQEKKEYFEAGTLVTNALFTKNDKRALKTEWWALQDKNLKRSSNLINIGWFLK